MLEVEGLTKYFSSGMIRKRYVKAVDGVSFQIGRGKTLGVVGESGCGKTTIGRLILRLIEPTGGKVFFDSIDMFSLNKSELRKIRPRMQMIFQDPDSSLDPRMKIRTSIAEPLKVHSAISKDERSQKIRELIETVGLNPEHVNRYPYQLSGGQNQRVVLARILAMNPDLIIADEPTSSLDVSVQAQILNLMKDLQKTFSHTYLFITHDLDVVRIMADQIAVMYLGRIVEIGETSDIFNGAKHPYTHALLSAAMIETAAGQRKRVFLKGETPGPIDIPAGCRFHTRCPRREEICMIKDPELVEVGRGHYVACHFV
ncbi:MAG: ATP-binding cassette domain-containing protein [ANME-2 cluster archaeon]|nr:ATP-binding cassette domain-containing protein [ANME-2 cluster archaeon]